MIEVIWVLLLVLLFIVIISVHSGLQKGFHGFSVVYNFLLTVMVFKDVFIILLV